ncbi:MAG: UDP-N-acetylmuramate--L-alanine ligase [Bacteroidota bacterium]
MNQEKHISTYFFLGIGGIGMSALARYFNQRGDRILGYDRTSSDLTLQLEKEGIDVFYDESEAINQLQNETIAQLIYTPAISKQNLIFDYAVQHQIPLIKRAKLIGEITKNKPTLAVAGTHGKTTTSAILAHILYQSNIQMTAFLGGILLDYDTNYLSTGDDVFVVEADEFDRSFLHLQPTAAVITSLDADHLDIYGSAEELTRTFSEFANLVSGDLFTSDEIEIGGKQIGFSPKLPIYAENIQIKKGAYHFDFVYEQIQLKSLQLNLPGKHNLFNAMAALSLAISYEPEKAINFGSALRSFNGVKRRFNYLLKEENKVIIDDYAHHPTEIMAVHQAITEMHPNENVMVIFQPHLFSRTQNFADDFARSLALFDEICILEIYPAREEPIEGIHADFLLEKIEHNSKKVISKTAILDVIKQSNCSVFAFLGAGDIGVEAKKVTKNWSNEV